MQKYVNLVDLVKSFPTSIYLQKIGVDSAENEPPKVWRKIQLILHSPPYCGAFPEQHCSAPAVPTGRHGNTSATRAQQLFGPNALRSVAADPPNTRMSSPESVIVWLKRPVGGTCVRITTTEDESMRTDFGALQGRETRLRSAQIFEAPLDLVYLVGLPQQATGKEVFCCSTCVPAKDTNE